MQENALKGFVEALGDPHSEYLTREENEVFDESMEGTQHFEGIGAVVSKKQDGIMISEVLK
jgi:carboxyl-terminal processing protease